MKDTGGFSNEPFHWQAASQHLSGKAFIVKEKRIVYANGPALEDQRPLSHKIYPILGGIVVLAVGLALIALRR